VWRRPEKVEKKKHRDPNAPTLNVVRKANKEVKKRICKKKKGKGERPFREGGIMNTFRGSEERARDKGFTPRVGKGVKQERTQCGSEARKAPL